MKMYRNQGDKKSFESFFVALSLLPASLLIGSFYTLEVAKLIGINGLWWLRAIAALMTIMVLFGGIKIIQEKIKIIKREIKTNIREKKTVKLKEHKRIDKIVSIAFITIIFIFCVKDSYTPPSMSVQYYLGYDYLRHLYQLGSYRPDLPVSDPSGTWINMLTYNPAIFGLAALTSGTASLESYRQAMGIINGIFQAGFLTTVSLLSTLIGGYYITGMIVGATFLAPIAGRSLVYATIYSASHDTPLIYLAAISCCLAFISTYKTKHKTGTQLNANLVIISVFITIISISVRPYLVGLLIISIYTVYMYIRQLYSNREKEPVRSGRSVYFTLALSGAIALAATWQLMLFFNYQRFSTYSHQEQFRYVTGPGKDKATILLSALSGIELPSSIIYSPFTSLIGIAIILTILREIKGILRAKEKGIKIWTKRYTIISTWILLTVAIFILTVVLPQTQLHWKSYITPIVGLYILVPILAISSRGMEYDSKHTRKKLSKRWNRIALTLYGLNTLFFTISITGEILGRNTNQLERDNERRELIKETYLTSPNKGKKILILRGGEPGGDAQSMIPNYYYWDNRFLFGDLDTKIDKINSANEFVTMLKKENIGFIFEPSSLTELRDDNHSGRKIYTKIIELIEQNPKHFIRQYTHSEGYRPVFYEIRNK